MSYNITQWRTKRLDALSLTLPLQFPEEMQGNGWRIEHQEPLRDGRLAFTMGDSVRIEGSLQEDGRLLVSSLVLEGEGSGTAYHALLLPALRESTGALDAVLIWEDGDSVSRLAVLDGEVTETAIEL